VVGVFLFFSVAATPSCQRHSSPTPAVKADERVAKAMPDLPTHGRFVKTTIRSDLTAWQHPLALTFCFAGADRAPRITGVSIDRLDARDWSCTVGPEWRWFSGTWTQESARVDVWSRGCERIGPGVYELFVSAGPGADGHARFRVRPDGGIDRLPWDNVEGPDTTSDCPDPRGVVARLE
jgi:hypothetical protein